MLELSLHQGDIYCCTKAEARKMWQTNPERRGRIWLQEEVTTCLLLDPAKLDSIYNFKINNIGSLITKDMVL
jgi:hypothetical protein